MKMNLSFYQEQAITTAVYPAEAAVVYPAMGLAGEAGEVLNKIKKVYRDKGGVLDDATKQEIAKELGDVLWYVAVLARDLGEDLEDTAKENLRKLQDRMRRGVIGGEGDNR
jgi:NTP pyrophosphatase (non-canonical NTP hydrolase)